jgi:hypothetical protein
MNASHDALGDGQPAKQVEPGMPDPRIILEI